MLHNRTTDIGQRVTHIAEREAEEIFKKNGGNFFKIFLELYDRILHEFVHETPEPTRRAA